MNRCSFCEWIPILPLPVWPLAGQFLLGQNVVVGSMTLLLALRGNIATRSMAGPPFALQLHRTTVWCGATAPVPPAVFPAASLTSLFGGAPQLGVPPSMRMRLAITKASLQTLFMGSSSYEVHGWPSSRIRVVFLTAALCLVRPTQARRGLQRGR